MDYDEAEAKRVIATLDGQLAEARTQAILIRAQADKEIAPLREALTECRDWFAEGGEKRMLDVCSAALAPPFTPALLYTRRATLLEEAALSQSPDHAMQSPITTRELLLLEMASRVMIAWTLQMIGDGVSPTDIENNLLGDPGFRENLRQQMEGVLKVLSTQVGPSGIAGRAGTK